MGETPFTQEQIDMMIKNYVDKKEYRRVYYRNKYQTDENYKIYVRDYNKIRYEEKFIINKLKETGVENEEKLLLSKANKLKKWFDKQNRPDDFKTKCPDDYMLIN
jgi:hypothetical protein